MYKQFGLNDGGLESSLSERIPSFNRACTVNLYLGLALIIAPVIAIIVIALFLSDSFARNAFLWVSGFTYCLCPLAIAIMLLRGIYRLGDVESLINRSRPVTIRLTLSQIPSQKRARSEIDLLISSGLFDSKKVLLEKIDQIDEKLTLAWNSDANLAAQLHKIRLWAFTKEGADRSIGNGESPVSIDSYWDSDALIALETSAWLAIVPAAFTEVYQPVSSWVPKQ